MVEPLAAEDPPRLGSFELTGRLGEGGQGVVYLGRGSEGEQVAVKLLHHGLAGDPEARARFLREVSVARRVARFCTASVLHADLAGSRPYIVSEYVPGPSLRELVTREGPRRGASLERLAVSTATALSAIHRAGILHRDFKPANVLMGPEGPVVIDFGIARALDSPGMTATGVAMGTPSYLAPEQLGSGEVTPAADVFAWGVTMVFAATGAPAFGQDSIAVVINRILNAEPELGTLEEPLRGLVTACLSKDPARRPTAEQLVSHLMGSGPTTPVRHGEPERSGSGRSGPEPGERKSPRPVGLLLAGVAVVAALGTVAGAVVLLPDDEKAAAARSAVTPTVSDVAEPEPTLVPDARKESPRPSETSSKTGSKAEEDTETVSAITPHPSSRSAEGPAPTTRKPTRKPSGSPSQTSGPPPGPTATTARPTPSAKPTTSARPSDTSGPSSSPKPTSKPTTAKPSVTVKPSPRPTPRKANSYTATGVCGSGYKVVDSRALGGAATVYLLYNAAAGKNCVVTMSKYVVPAKIAMNATLQVKGGSSGSNPGNFTVYAGPVRLPAAKKCVIWGGSHGSLSWKSGWSHCG